MRLPNGTPDSVKDAIEQLVVNADSIVQNRAIHAELVRGYLLAVRDLETTLETVVEAEDQRRADLIEKARAANEAQMRRDLGEEAAS